MADEEHNPAPAAKRVHEPFQKAHEAYVQALDEAWTQAQRDCQNNQLEFQQRMMKLSRATTADEYKVAQESVQQMMTATPAAPGSGLEDAFVRYKEAVKSALGEVDPRDLDPGALAAIGQSLYMIAQFASQAAMFAPPKTS
jgi:hypothetical protein